MIKKYYDILPSEGGTEPKYVMGIDPHGYDGKTSSICVMKLVNGTIDTVAHVATYHGRPEPDFEAEVKKLADFYKIPEDHILTEQRNKQG